MIRFIVAGVAVGAVCGGVLHWGLVATGVASLVAGCLLAVVSSFGN
jgi:hypothetical protein